MRMHREACSSRAQRSAIAAVTPARIDSGSMKMFANGVAVSPTHLVKRVRRSRIARLIAVVSLGAVLGLIDALSASSSTRSAWCQTADSVRTRH